MQRVWHSTAYLAGMASLIVGWDEGIRISTWLAADFALAWYGVLLFAFAMLNLFLGWQPGRRFLLYVAGLLYMVAALCPSFALSTG